jgi:hypothetical protein
MTQETIATRRSNPTRPEVDPFSMIRTLLTTIDHICANGFCHAMRAANSKGSLGIWLIDVY